MVSLIRNIQQVVAKRTLPPVVKHKTSAARGRQKRNAALPYLPSVTQQHAPTAEPTRHDLPLSHPLTRARRLPLIGLLAVGTLAISYVSYHYVQYRKSAVEYEFIPTFPVALKGSGDMTRVYDKKAPVYDREVDLTERLSGTTGLRKQVCAKATGHVLEMSVGTGRNAEFYPLDKGQIKTVTMVDRSSEMIRVARAKWTDHNAWWSDALFRIQDAEEAVPRPMQLVEQRRYRKDGPPPENERLGGFDTVIQTMGVCSTGEPETVLRNMGEMARSREAGKEDGKIYLLEHGKGYYNWLNKLLDSSAPKHAEEWGCWWNKDIGEIVEKSGLEIVEQKRYQLGTVWYFELRPPKKTAELPGEKVEFATQQSQSEEPRAGNSWYSSGLK